MKTRRLAQCVLAVAVCGASGAGVCAQEPNCDQIAALARIARAKSSAVVIAEKQKAGDSYRAQVVFAGGWPTLVFVFSTPTTHEVPHPAPIWAGWETTKASPVVALAFVLPAPARAQVILSSAEARPTPKTFPPKNQIKPPTVTSPPESLTNPPRTVTDPPMNVNNPTHNVTRQKQFPAGGTGLIQRSVANHETNPTGSRLSSIASLETATCQTHLRRRVPAATNGNSESIPITTRMCSSGLSRMNWRTCFSATLERISTLKSSIDLSPIATCANWKLSQLHTSSAIGRRYSLNRRVIWSII